MAKKQKMVICRNCNTAILKKSKRCPACGAKNKKPFYKKWWFIILLIIMGFSAVNTVRTKIKERFDWNEIVLSERLPKPKSKSGTIISNDSDRLCLYVDKTSASDYQSYLKECQDMGYILEGEEDGNRYNAFDEAGYELSLSYIGEQMNIELEEPMELGELSWPKSEIANMIPQPKSTVGKVSSDSAEGCYIYIGETSVDDFNSYIDECAEYGFTVDYERGEKFYNAVDEQGNRLSVTYKGNNVMIVQVRVPEETEEETETKAVVETEVSEMQTEKVETEVKATETQTEEIKVTETPVEETEVVKEAPVLVDGMRPEFKQAMDSYEEFMNEYCDFMKKYSESDGTDVSLLLDYASYMSKYADVVEDFEAWDDDEMNNTEIAYYLEIQTRISTKLLEVAE